MSYVQVNFDLPTSSIRLPAFPGRCRLELKRGTKTIRAAAPRPRLILVPKRGPQYLAGFWSTLLNGSVKLFNAVQGTHLPSGSAKQQQQSTTQTQEQQQQLGPLASVSTSTLVVGGLAFSALILVLAGRGR